VPSHIRVTIMHQHKAAIIPADPIAAAMIELARCADTCRIMLAGRSAPERMFDLHRRGYRRVATTATCGLPRGQYDVAFVEWPSHSIAALEATLSWLVHFLSPLGVLVIWVDAQERCGQRKLRYVLEKLDFRIEAGIRCENGIAISARRLETTPLAMAA
jgi:hypothetical protein